MNACGSTRRAAGAVRGVRGRERPRAPRRVRVRRRAARARRGAGAAYAGARPRGARHRRPRRRAYGYGGPIPWYALAAQRHMDLYGTTSDQLGAIAVATRAWAAGNPRAALREPITLDALPRVAVGRRSRSTCSTAASSRTAASASSSRAPSAPATCASRPPTSAAWGRGTAATSGARSWDARRARPPMRERRAAFAMADARRADVTRLQALRLLHVHGAGDARGLRLLREGRGRRRSSRTASSARAARCRRTPAAASSRRSTCGA